MLYFLLYQILDINIFKYITFRSFYAFLTAFAISLILGPFIIRKLKEFHIKKGGYIREDTPDQHQGKKNTPSMGGLLIVSSLSITTLLWCRLDIFWIIITLTTLVVFALIGLLDDYRKLQDNKGLKAKHKFLLQIGTATLIALAIFYYPKFDPNLYFPIFKNLYIDLGYLYIPFIVIIIVGTSNAVNLTDGLDGLAIGPTLVATAAYAYIAYVVGNFMLANYLFVPHVDGAGELTVFLMAMLGAGFGFLWFNSFPAEMFMGDAGSLSIGAVLGIIAIITKQELLLVLIGGIFVLETLSVITQVLYFKMTGGRRLFLMAPIHHHFELKGIPEPKIVVRVWIISIILAIIALSTLKIR